MTPRAARATSSIALIVIVATMAGCASRPALDETVVTLIHFSDYHSHAVPFRDDDGRERGGIARLAAYLDAQRREHDALVFSGGDMMNRGTPAWSDRHRCLEWEWLNGRVDAMAFGNHDADYGAAEFERCRASIDFPILSANLTADGVALLTHHGATSAIFERDGIAIGVIALAGDDFRTLLRPEIRPHPSVEVAGRAETARREIETLRNQTDAIVLIGHAHVEEDRELARRVEGIDIVFGSHSHIAMPLQRVEGTETWMIAAEPYAASVARIELVFREGSLAAVRGQVVPIDGSLQADRGLEAKVAELQRELESDPAYRSRFEPIGTLGAMLRLGSPERERSEVAAAILEVVRRRAQADVAFSTASSFRRALPAGTIRMEDLRATLPYPNEALTITMGGADLRRLLRLSASLRGTDAWLQSSGGESGSDGAIRIGGEPLDDERRYRIVVTDYLARVASPYRSFFSSFETTPARFEVREAVAEAIERGALAGGE